MKKYSKDKLIRKRWIKFLIILLIVIIVSLISLVIYINVINHFVYDDINNDAIHISDEKAQESTPIILNNIVIGAVYKNEWTSCTRYYNKSKIKEKTEMELFTSKGKAGVFNLEVVNQINGNVVGFTNSTNRISEYIAIIKNENYNYLPMTKIVDYESKADDYNSKIKEALGLYNILNDSIQINNVYEACINAGENVTLLEVTSSKENKNGAYSTLIMIDGKGNPSVVKYNYIKNRDKAEDFKIYNIKFVLDLNNDLKNELVIQEVDEFETKYSVLEYRNNKFVTVLNEVIKNK